MSLAAGRHTLAIPGPSVMPERVLQAMHRGAPNIYEGALMDMTDKVLRQLCEVARTEGRVAMYIANGHGAWEAALWNTLVPGDKVLVLSTGRFAKGWAEMAGLLGIDVEMMDFGTASPADASALEERLRTDKSHEIKAVLTTQTDTASSVTNDIAALRRAIDAASHPSLYMVDCIASLACERFEMDAWGVDVMVAGCQKGLMVPPGTSFVFANAKAMAARERITRISPYFDWVPRLNPKMFYQLFFGTAPTHHLFGLDTSLDMILEEEGLEAVWRRHNTLASAVWAAVDTWGASGKLRANIAEIAHRSTAVTTIHTHPGDAAQLRQWCEAEANVTLGIGLGLEEASSAPMGDSLFRIGHMGHLNAPMVMGTLGTVDTGLKSLNIAHGSGALEAAAAALANGVSVPVRAVG